MIQKAKAFGFYAFFFFLLMSCKNGYLRGYEEISHDGNTYLVIEHDRGGGTINEVFIDNELWQNQIGKKGSIDPGNHTISSTAEDCYIEFSITKGTIFHFDYWGP